MIASSRPAKDLQKPFDVAVVIATILRPVLKRAVRSVFNQDFRGRIQILIGIDIAKGDPQIVDELVAECPPTMAITVLDPGYSTSERNGGIYRNRDGGCLRTVLSFLANSPLVAYLDDDNWWAPHHLSDLVAAIDGHDYAFAMRWMVDGVTEEVLCVDDFGSLGPGKGIYTDKGFHGQIDTNCLMLDRDRCLTELWAWSVPFYLEGTSDRTITKALHDAGRSFASTDKPSVYYVMDPHGVPYPPRDKALAERGVTPSRAPGPPPENFYAGRARRIRALIEGEGPHRLRLADRDELRDGWVTMTLAHGHPDILPLNPRRKLSFRDASFDEIVIDGLLENLAERRALFVLKEMRRILKADGRIRVSTLDLRRVAGLLSPRLAAQRAEAIRAADGRPLRDGKLAPSAPARAVNARLFGGGHRRLYDLPSLGEILYAAGFRDIRQTTDTADLDAGDERLIVEARKDPNPRRGPRGAGKKAADSVG